MNNRSYSAFYKGGVGHGFFECLSGDKRETTTHIEGKLVKLYPQTNDSGTKKWFVLYLELGGGKHASVFLNSERKNTYPILELIFEYDLYGKYIFLKATTERVQIGEVGEKKHIPISLYFMKGQPTHKGAIEWIGYITGEENTNDNTPNSRKLFSADELNWLISQQAKEEGLEWPEMFQNILTLHFVNRWSNTASASGYKPDIDGIMQMMKQEYGYETR